jgi:hypothetical protein
MLQYETWCYIVSTLRAPLNKQLNINETPAADLLFIPWTENIYSDVPEMMLRKVHRQHNSLPATTGPCPIQIKPFTNKHDCNIYVSVCLTGTEMTNTSRSAVRPSQLIQWAHTILWLKSEADHAVSRIRKVEPYATPPMRLICIALTRATFTVAFTV